MAENDGSGIPGVTGSPYTEQEAARVARFLGQIATQIAPLMAAFFDERKRQEAGEADPALPAHDREFALALLSMAVSYCRVVGAPLGAYLQMAHAAWATVRNVERPEGEQGKPIEVATQTVNEQDEPDIFPPPGLSREEWQAKMADLHWMVSYFTTGFNTMSIRKGDKLDAAGAVYALCMVTISVGRSAGMRDGDVMAYLSDAARHSIAEPIRFDANTPPEKRN